MTGEQSGAIDLPLDLKTLALGGERTVIAFAPEPCVNCEGSGRDEGEVCAFCGGGGTMETEREVTVRLDAGLAEGDTVIIPVEGMPGGILAIVREERHPTLTRDGHDLRTVLDVEADVLDYGDVFDIDTLDGEAELRVAEGTQDGAILRLPGEGLPVPGTDERGDLQVEIRVLPPVSSEAVREARERGGGSLRAGAIMIVLGLVFLVSAIAVRAAEDFCEPSATVRCVVVIDGVARGETDLTADQQRERADRAMVITMIPGVALVGVGLHFAFKGIRQRGEFRSQEGQRRAV